MAIRLTARDLELLAGVHSARYLTTPQIQALFWQDSRGGRFGGAVACRARLKKLADAGYLRRIAPLVTYGTGKKPTIYALGRAGARVLGAELGVYPNDVDGQAKDAEASYLFLAHLLATNDLRIALHLACARQPGVALETWVSEKELNAAGRRDYVEISGPEGGKQKTAVIPDAAFTLRRDTKLGLFLLEIDRRTVTVDSVFAHRAWTRKVKAYLVYFASDPFRQRYGVQTARVLTVTTGEERLAHLKTATETVGGDGRFRFTTFDEATDPDTVLSAPIWRKAGADGRFALLG